MKYFCKSAVIDCKRQFFTKKKPDSGELSGKQGMEKTTKQFLLYTFRSLIAPMC